MTPRQPCWCLQQKNIGHVGVKNYSSRSLTFPLWFRKLRTAGHVSVKTLLSSSLITLPARRLCTCGTYCGPLVSKRTISIWSNARTKMLKHKNHYPWSFSFLTPWRAWKNILITYLLSSYLNFNTCFLSFSILRKKGLSKKRTSAPLEKRLDSSLRILSPLTAHNYSNREATRTFASCQSWAEQWRVAVFTGY